jgi:RecA/RadA recombinase
MKILQGSDFTQVYFDYDDAVDREMIARSGVRTDRVVFPSCGSLEEGFDTIKAVTDDFYGKRAGPRKAKKSEVLKARAAAHRLAVLWDSLWASAPKALLEAKSAEQRLIGTEAAAYSAQFKRMRHFMRGRPMVMLFTNEAREDIGGYSPWGPQTKQPGGRAVRHYMTTVLKLGRAGMEKRTIKGRERTIGMWVQVTAQKARFGVMGRKAKFFISFSKASGGPDPIESNFAFLKEMNFLKSGPDKTFGIRGLKDISPFSKKEWPEVMKKHEKQILGMLKEELCTDKVVDVDDSSEDEV